MDSGRRRHCSTLEFQPRRKERRPAAKASDGIPRHHCGFCCAFVPLSPPFPSHSERAESDLSNTFLRSAPPTTSTSAIAARYDTTPHSSNSSSSCSATETLASRHPAARKAPSCLEQILHHSCTLPSRPPPTTNTPMLNPLCRSRLEACGTAQFDNLQYSLLSSPVLEA